MSEQLTEQQQSETVETQLIGGTAEDAGYQWCEDHDTYCRRWSIGTHEQVPQKQAQFWKDQEAWVRQNSEPKPEEPGLSAVIDRLSARNIDLTEQLSQAKDELTQEKMALGAQQTVINMQIKAMVGLSERLDAAGKRYGEMTLKRVVTIRSYRQMQVKLEKVKRACKRERVFLDKLRECVPLWAELQIWYQDNHEPADARKRRLEGLRKRAEKRGKN